MAKPISTHITSQSFNLPKLNWGKLGRYGLVLLSYFAVFSLLDFFYRDFAVYPGVYTWNPSTGVAFALLLALGAEFAPVLLITSLVSGVLIHQPPLFTPEILGRAISMSVIFGLATWLLRERIRINPKLGSLRDTVWLTGIIGVVSILISLIHLLGWTDSSFLLGTNRLEDMILTGVGEAASVLITTPVLLMFIMPGIVEFIETGKIKVNWPAKHRFPSRWTLWLAGSVVFTLLLVIILSNNLTGYHYIYILALPLLLTALHSGLPATSLCILVINYVLTSSQWTFQLPFDDLVEVQILLLGMSATGLMTGALVSERKQSEELTRKSENRFRSLIENGLDNISLLDSHGVLLWESPATVRTLGYTPDEFLGHNTFDLIHPDDLEIANNLFKEVLAEPGNRRQAIFRLRHRDDTWRWIEGIATNLLDEPSVHGVALNYRDINARKQTELALSESEQRFRSIFETSADAIVLIDPHDPVVNWKILDCNEVFCRMNGYNRAELIGQSIDLVNVEHTTPEENANYLDIVRREGVIRIRSFHRHKDGHVFPIEISGSTFSFEGRELVLGIDRDISEREQAEQTIREAEMRYRTLVERIPAVTYIFDQTQLVPRDVFVSPQIKQILGFTPEEWLAASPNLWKQQIHQDDLERVLAVDKASREANKPFICEYRIHKKDGQLIWLHEETHYSQEPSLKGLTQGTMFDITEHKRAEEALGQAQAKYQNIFENANEGIYQTTVGGQYIMANPALARMFGYASPEELMDSVTDLNHQFYVAHGRRGEFMRLMDEFGIVNGFESEIYCRDGSTMWVSENSHAVRGGKGEILYYEGTTEDITKRKRAEAALRASEESYRYLFENNPLPMWVYDPITLQFLAVNECAIDHYGFTRDEFLAKTIEDIRPAEELKRLRENLESRQEKHQSSGPWVHRKKDGSLIDVEIDSNELSVNGKDSRLVLVRDVTARIKAERATRQRLAELEAVNRISTALRSASSLDEMLPILLDETLAVMGTTAGTIKLYDASQDALVPIVSRGWYQHMDDVLIKPGAGTSGMVFSTGQPYLAREFVTDQTTLKSVITTIPEGWGGACVPIRTAQSISGVLFIAVELPRELDQVDLKLLNTLAEIAGNAIHRTRLHEQANLQVQRLAALRAIDEAIATSFDLKLTLNVLLGYVVQELEVDAADILLVNHHLQTLEYAASIGFRSRAIERTNLRLGQGLPGQAALDRQPVIVHDLQHEPNFLRSTLLSGETFKAYNGIPLVIKGEVKGVLEIFHRSELITGLDWTEFLKAMAGQAAIAIDNAELFEGLTRSNIELAVAYDGTIEGWSRALDLRDKETEGHTERVTALSLQLARSLGFSEAELVQVRRGGLLHDIGKMGVPDAILFKPGPLTEDEWVLMRKHPRFAYELLSGVKYLQPALDIPYCHHEKWDGSGYPQCLKGEQIPISARIFAVVDVWDALRSDRPYRKAWSKSKARKYIQSQSGSHFDPRIADRFLAMLADK